MSWPGLITTVAFFVISVGLMWRQARSNQNEGPKCPRCGAELRSGALRCPSCGVSQQVYEVVTAPEVAPQEETGDSSAIHAIVRGDLCVGCGACIPTCPEAGAIRMQGKLAIVDQQLCVSHAKCVEACPVGAIFMGEGGAGQRMQVPALGSDFQSNIPGIYIVGELGGRGLIKNAINEGRLAAEAAAKALTSSRDASFDVAIVGSGPAGISAALECQRQGLNAVLLEQGTLADSIRRYPRKKFLLAEPIQVPLFGALWVADGSKEELLHLWEQIVSAHDLRVESNQRVSAVEGEDGGFRLHTTEKQWSARKVILAMGRRGTPRRLNVPGESRPKVFYDIAEMEAFQGDRILVVGGGDSALESALGLSRQPGTNVHLSYRKDRFDRAKDRNRENLDAAVAAGAIVLLLNSQVEEILEGRVRLRDPEGVRHLDNDTVIVRVGGEAPDAFLDRVGIRRIIREVPIAPALS